MKLFKDITIKRKLDYFKIPNLENKISILKKWLDDYENGSLKQDNETARAPGYNQDIFFNILGYTRKPAEKATFDAEYNVKGKRPDGVLGFFHTDKEKEDNVCAVLELKGANIPLDQPQKREKNYTPIEQAFGYKRRLRNCPFVIVSNFYELRLYNDNELDYEIWTLDELIDSTDNYYNFKKFYYLLSEENLITENGISNTESLLSEIRIEEQEITKKFYKDYKEKRHYLLQNLYQKNEILRKDPDLLIEKGQKIIDRIIFMCFAEDKGLLPADTLQNILAEYNKSTIASSLKNTLEQAFVSIDKGNEKWDIPNGYNGGLFKNDPILNDLKIDDSILAMVIDFGKYDFADQLSVTILGHIFEQSISDLEEIKEKIQEKNFTQEEQENTEKEKKVSKRKKDGIFYTPEYIVDYIVKNSLGKYLREKETEIIEKYNFDRENLKEITREKKKKQAYTEYQEFLKTVKVLDPACGSGAFLVRVFDYLLAEHQKVGNIIGTLFDTDETYKNILQNNIYGVDLNQESVEITKLSLWLKSAEKGKKLSNLDQNIKCGNSLIDDPEVAGDKAFNWNEEFSEIMKNGGFDIVVGNPPYFNIQSLGIKSPIAKAIQESYPEIWQDKSDIIFYFIALAIKLIKNKVGFIVSNAFMFSDKAKKLRNYILENAPISKITNFEKYMVFDDASITTAIIELDKNKKDTMALAYSFKEKKYIQEQVSNIINHNKNYFEVELKKNSVFALVDKKIDKINQKIDSSYSKLNTIFKIGKGMETAANKVFLFKEYPKQFPKEFIKKRMSGEIIKKYEIDGLKEYILYFEDVEDFDDLPLSIQEHLNKNREFLENRAQIKRSPTSKWWKYTFPMHKEYYHLDKIWCSYRAKENIFCFDDTKEYIGLTNTTVIFDTNESLNLKYLLALLNSKTLNFRYKSIGKQTGSGVYEYFENGVGKFPIPDISQEEQRPFIEKADLMLKLNKNFYEQKLRFLKRIQDNYELEKINKKLESFYEMEFRDFIKELRKQKAKISLSDQDELEEYFEKNKNELMELDQKIKKIDSEIDQMVYRLYDLNDEEIKIIENE